MALVYAPRARSSEGAKRARAMEADAPQRAKGARVGAEYFLPLCGAGADSATRGANDCRRQK